MNNENLSKRQKAVACYRLACRMATHRDAEQFAIEAGYADDPADFDAKVYEIEDEGASR